MKFKFFWIWISISCLLALTLLACGGGSRTTTETESNNRPNNQTNSEQASPRAPTEPGSKVSRRNSNVALGNAGQPDPQLLTDNDWHDLRSGDRISTDGTGEAEVNIVNCMRVYVFKASRLVRAACPRSAYESGSVTCAAAGTSLFNNSCGSRVVIQTDTAEISLDGTYLSVTYLSAEQSTLVWVLKGQVEVRPVVAFEARTLGEPVVVTEGNFMLTTPEGRLSDNLGIRSGTPTPVDQIQRLATAFKLQPWLERIVEQAKADNIPVPSLSRTMDFVPSSINCDCDNVSAGLLTGPYKRQCINTENRLKAELAQTGNITGKCDPVASGPNAVPK